MRKTKRVKKTDKGNKKVINYYFSTENTKFTHLLKITSKWTEIYKSGQGKLSILISLISSIIWCYIFNVVEIEMFNEIIRNVTFNVFISLIGMLGFIISGLAILTGTITKKVIEIISEERMIDSLIGILFSFYFIGGFIGFTIFSFILMYLLSFPNIIATNIRVGIISFLLSYLFSFSITYSIAQLGTCLRIFLVSYRFMDKDKERTS